MKKLLLIAVVVAGFVVAGAPRAEAGVSVGIGIGVPFGFGYGCYPYGYPAYYPYGYGYSGYYSPGYVRVVNRPYYWYHGRRIYYGHRHHWR
jgi:hypothetical protein